MAFELIYYSEKNGAIHWFYQQEAEIMRKAGLTVRTEPTDAATCLLRRCLIVDEEDFPQDPRYIQDAKTYANLTRTDRWYPLITDLTIPTFFCNQLDSQAVALTKERGWSRCFVKNAVKSLVEQNPLDSVWPDVSFVTMEKEFAIKPRKGPYALRQYFPPEHFKDECRYWVIGDQVHHSSGNIPDIVFEAKKRLAVFEGVFYNIDATQELIVEINSGESSDRKTDNRAEDFAKWISEAFN
jgi:hypothetical protein